MLPRGWLVLRLCLEEQAEVSQNDSSGVCGTSPWRCLIDDGSFPVSKSFSHLMSRIEIGPLHKCRASVHSGPPKSHRGALISGQHFSYLHDAFAPSSHSVPFAAAAKSLQSCPTLSDPIDGSPPGSPVPGILQARTLERVAISFSNA